MDRVDWERWSELSEEERERVRAVLRAEMVEVGRRFNEACESASRAMREFAETLEKLGPLPDDGR